MSRRPERPFGWRTGKALNWALGDVSDNRDFLRVFVIVCLGGGIIGTLGPALLPAWVWDPFLVVVVLVWAWMILVWHLQKKWRRNR